MTLPLDWESLTFSLHPTKKMFLAKTRQGEPWGEGEFVPYGDIKLSPAAGVLNYGQGIFEGMKACKTRRGEVVLFRPHENGKRFAKSAERLCMPPIPVEYFVDAIKNVVKENQEYIPPFNKGSLYIRPCLWGTGPILGVAPAPEYTFLIYVSPVGAYYKKGLKPIRVLVCEAYHRAAPKGTGDVKYIGNYAGTLLTLQHAKLHGFDGCIYLDAQKSFYIEEVGTANFFCVIENQLVTPKLGSILPGITRDSIIIMARELLNMTVIEKDISIEEVQKASECFCVGTAAVVTSIGSITYLNKEVIFNNYAIGPITQKIYDKLIQIQLHEVKDPFQWVETVDLN